MSHLWQSPTPDPLGSTALNRIAEALETANLITAVKQLTLSDVEAYRYRDAIVQRLDQTLQEEK